MQCKEKDEIDLSTVSSKYFKRLLKSEQKGMVISANRVNLLRTSSIISTVSSLNVLRNVKNVTPKLSTSVIDIKTPVVECYNTLVEPFDSNYCIPCVDTSSEFH